MSNLTKKSCCSCNMPVLLLSIALLSSPIASAREPSGEEMQNLRGTGMTAVRNHDTTRALAIFQKYISDSPNDPQGYFWEGLALQNAGRLDQAMEQYQLSLRSADTGPVDSAELRNNLASLLFQKGRFAEAESHYKRALEIDARAADVKLNYAQLLLSENRVNEAANCLADLTSRLRYDPRFCLLQGITLLKQGRNTEAVQYLQECHNLGNQNSSYRNGAQPQPSKEAMQMASYADRILETMPQPR